MSDMFKKTSTAMLVGLLAIAPAGAFAQNETSSEEPAATAEESDGMMTTEGGSDTQMSEDSQTEMSQDGSGMSEMDSEEQAQPVEGQIVMQSEDTILANDLLGSPVYSQNDESIGNINDMIVTLDGGVEGIVIGVGGFLGIGEKSVALEMDSLSTETDENGNIRLMTSATSEDLEAAEAFVPASQQEAMQETQDAAESQGMSGSGETDTMGTGSDSMGSGSGETMENSDGTQSQ